MKELSIEEKAKAYDDALEKAKMVLQERGNEPDGAALLSKLFPHLKESDDERIRKNLIKSLDDILKQNAYMHGTCFKYVNVKEAIAWLEKQGEHYNFLHKIQIGDHVTRNEDGVLVNLSQLKRVTKKDEKQGEQKPTIEMKSAEESLGIDSDTYNKIVDECIYGEQKPADKVKPKFKVGDWIVFNGLTLYVEEVVEGFYRTISKGGITNSYGWDIDNAARLWTIQDAKDGDVLSYRDSQWIFIYKGIVTEDTFKYYALLSEKGITVNDAAFSLLTYCITPATKEQRDTLMKAMADAGYTFDFEKKELKKVEPNSAEDGDLPEFESYLCLMFQKFRTKGMCTNGEIIDYVKEHSQKLKDILVKPAWSEEDEAKLKSILFHIEDVENKDVIDWLKSLKDRVQPQPKQEWSEEDEKMIRALVSMCDVWATSHQFYPKENKEMEALKTWLKSLHPKKQWKPSEEQMAQLQKYCLDNRPLTLLYEQLKTL